MRLKNNFLIDELNRMRIYLTKQKKSGRSNEILRKRLVVKNIDLANKEKGYVNFNSKNW